MNAQIDDRNFASELARPDKCYIGDNILGDASPDALTVKPREAAGK